MKEREDAANKGNGPKRRRKMWFQIKFIKNILL
jgi:hypothetical protein